MMVCPTASAGTMKIRPSPLQAMHDKSWSFFLGNENWIQTFLFSNFSGTSGISRQNPGISRQKCLASLVSRDIPNFLAPTPSRGRPPPHRRNSGPKSLGLFLFLAWLSGKGSRNHQNRFSSRASWCQTPPPRRTRIHPSVGTWFGPDFGLIPTWDRSFPHGPSHTKNTTIIVIHYGVVFKYYGGVSETPCFPEGKFTGNLQKSRIATVLVQGKERRIPVPVPPFFLKRPCNGEKNGRYKRICLFFAVEGYVPGGSRIRPKQMRKNTFRPVPVQKFTFPDSKSLWP